MAHHKVMSSGEALELILTQLTDPHDRHSASLVSRKWHEIEGLTRRHVKISMCYSVSPARLKQRFPHLESLILKGKPRAAMFSLLPENWGGYASSWIAMISESFNTLKKIHLRRMVVTDGELEVLCRSHGRILQVLKLDMCCGFSTDGLLCISQSCRVLKNLVLEESLIDEKDGEWLHELALNNTVLETLDFYSTELAKINAKDLELLARKCHSLVSVKISNYDMLGLVDFFHAAKSLREFCGGAFMQESSSYLGIKLPPRLCYLGLTYIGRDEMAIVFPTTILLKRLDLRYAMLDADDHCELLQRCPNLEDLDVRNVIGDRGLATLARTCPGLKRLRIEPDAEDAEVEFELVTHRGLSSLAQGCHQLEDLTVYVSDIANSALESIGTFCKNLCDFRLILLEQVKMMTELPLDNGVQSLLRGCQKIRRFSLYLRDGGLTDVGLGYIGQYGKNIRWMNLGDVGESDAGLLELSRGCPKLQKLEMRRCCFSEHALAFAVLQLTSLRYLWVQLSHTESAAGRDLLSMVRPFWNIEFLPPSQKIGVDEHGRVRVIKNHIQVLAYYSLAGQRTDCPDTILTLDKLREYVNNHDRALKQ